HRLAGGMAVLVEVGDGGAEQVLGMLVRSVRELEVRRLAGSPDGALGGLVVPALVLGPLEPVPPLEGVAVDAGLDLLGAVAASVLQVLSRDDFLREPAQGTPIFTGQVDHSSQESHDV